MKISSLEYVKMAEDNFPLKIREYSQSIHSDE